MMYYHSMLNPDLYDDEFVANFVDSLLESEIDVASNEQLARLKREMIPTDDIGSLADSLMVESQDRVLNTGTLTPHFIAFTDKERRIRFELQESIPTKYQDIKQFLSAGKALGMIRNTQCNFFATLQPLINDRPAIGSDVADTCPWGILLIGSSLRGNCFVHINKMIRTDDDKLCFTPLQRDILREGKFQYPFNRFYHIEDANEMNEIISQIPRLMVTSNLSESECLVNFATTLKALQYFGYNQGLK